jgi:hypothetical protein
MAYSAIRVIRASYDNATPRLVSQTDIIVEVTSEPKSVGVSVKSIETAGSLDGDHHVTQHRVHLTGQDMIDAPDVIAKVAQAGNYLLPLSPSGDGAPHFTISAQMGR